MRNLDRKQLIIKVTSAVAGHIQRAVGRDGGRHSFGLGVAGGGEGGEVSQGSGFGATLTGTGRARQEAHGRKVTQAEARDTGRESGRTAEPEEGGAGQLQQVGKDLHCPDEGFGDHPRGTKKPPNVLSQGITASQQYSQRQHC